MDISAERQRNANRGPAASTLGAGCIRIGHWRYGGIGHGRYGGIGHGRYRRVVCPPQITLNVRRRGARHHFRSLNRVGSPASNHSPAHRVGFVFCPVIRLLGGISIGFSVRFESDFSILLLSVLCSGGWLLLSFHSVIRRKRNECYAFFGVIVPCRCRWWNHACHAPPCYVLCYTL